MKHIVKILGLGAFALPTLVHGNHRQLQFESQEPQGGFKGEYDFNHLLDWYDQMCVDAPFCQITKKEECDHLAFCNEEQPTTAKALLCTDQNVRNACPRACNVCHSLVPGVSEVAFPAYFENCAYETPDDAVYLAALLEQICIEILEDASDKAEGEEIEINHIQTVIGTVTELASVSVRGVGSSDPDPDTAITLTSLLEALNTPTVKRGSRISCVTRSVAKAWFSNVDDIMQETSTDKTLHPEAKTELISVLQEFANDIATSSIGVVDYLAVDSLGVDVLTIDNSFGVTNSFGVDKSLGVDKSFDVGSKVISAQGINTAVNVWSRFKYWANTDFLGFAEAAVEDFEPVGKVPVSASILV